MKNVFHLPRSCKNASTSSVRTGRHIAITLNNESERQIFEEVTKTRLRTMNTKLSTASKVKWWQKHISRNQESTIMTPLRLLETSCSPICPYFCHQATLQSVVSSVFILTGVSSNELVWHGSSLVPSP